MDSHERALEQRHHKLDREISAEQARPHPDDLVLAELKKRKLVLKDTLAHH